MLYPIGSNSINVEIVNGSPYITISANFIGRIYSMDANSKYLDNSVLESISTQANNYLNEVFTNYLYKTSLEFKSDINDFGRYATSSFITLPEYEQYNWKSNYLNATFKVDIHTNVESGFLVTET